MCRPGRRRRLGWRIEMGKRRFLSFAIFGVYLCGTMLSWAADATSSRTPTPERVLLPGLVREALERNPEILAARRAVEAKRVRIPQAGAWPDPRLSVSYAGNLLPPFTVMPADPSSARQIMAEQEIPYPGKTRLRTEI